MYKHPVGFVRFILDIPKNVQKIQLRRAFLTSFAVLRYHDNTLFPMLKTSKSKCKFEVKLITKSVSYKLYVYSWTLYLQEK